MDLKFKDNSKLKLVPFTQLEYIDANGACDVDTGIVVNSSTSIMQSIMQIGPFPSERWLYSWVFGTRSTAFGLGWDANSSTDRPITLFPDGTKTSFIFPRNERHDIEIYNNNGGKLKYDGELILSNSTQPNIPNNSKFYVKFGGSLPFRYYRVCVKQSDIVVLDLYPVKDSRDVICFYDTVSQTFFYNQGTGDFVAGPEVPSTIIKLPDNICLKTTTLYHKNTPNVNGLNFLNYILSAQKTAEDVVLNRIRVDIGNVSGSLSELMKFAGMAGFNDDYEPQAKPRLVGTYTVTDWYTQEQLTAAQAAFDGLTIVPDQNYLIDLNEMAVQVLDDTQPNYNPAVAIILQTAGRGVTLKTPVISGQTGRWFLTKTQAAAITSIGSSFKSKTNVTDTNGIVTSDVTATYAFTSFDEFQYFSGVTIGCALEGSTGVKYITLPPNFTTLNDRDWWGINFIRVTLNEIATDLGTRWSVAYNGSIQNLIYRSIEQASKFKLVKNENYAISVNNVYVNDTLLTELTIDDSITDIGYTKVLGGSLTKILLHNNITRVNISNTGVSTVGLVGSGADIELPTSVTTFGPSKNLTSIELPSSITNLSPSCFYGSSVGPQNFLIIPSGVTVIPSYCFSGMKGIGIIELKGNITKFENLAFYTGDGVVHLCGTTIPTIVYPEYYTRKTYVGLGQSQADDEALLATFRANSTWSGKNLDTWYNYLHPTT